MTRAVQPTAAQLLALKLAAVEPIRYYKGGWYSIPDVLGDDQRDPMVGGKWTTPATLQSCVDRGWLTCTGGTIYEVRWPITAAGRALAAKEQGE